MIRIATALVAVVAAASPAFAASNMNYSTMKCADYSAMDMAGRTTVANNVPGNTAGAIGSAKANGQNTGQAGASTHTYNLTPQALDTACASNGDMLVTDAARNTTRQ